MLTPLKVFCCYARKDQEMLIELKKHLAPLSRQGQITIWSDTNLNAGVQWKKELHQHLESADIILLLISPDFMDSEYCYSIEIGRAIERDHDGSAKVIPVLLRSTFWQNAPFAKLQMVPTNARPVTNWPDRDDAFHDITMQVSRVVSELHNTRAPIHGDTDDKVVHDALVPLAPPLPSISKASDPMHHRSPSPNPFISASSSASADALLSADALAQDMSPRTTSPPPVLHLSPLPATARRIQPVQSGTPLDREPDNGPFHPVPSRSSLPKNSPSVPVALPHPRKRVRLFALFLIGLAAIVIIGSINLVASPF